MPEQVSALREQPVVVGPVLAAAAAVVEVAAVVRIVLWVVAVAAAAWSAVAAVVAERSALWVVAVAQLVLQGALALAHPAVQPCLHPIHMDVFHYAGAAGLVGPFR